MFPLKDSFSMLHVHIHTEHSNTPTTMIALATYLHAIREIQLYICNSITSCIYMVYNNYSDLYIMYKLNQLVKSYDIRTYKHVLST